MQPASSHHHADAHCRRCRGRRTARQRDSRDRPGAFVERSARRAPGERRPGSRARRRPAGATADAFAAGGSPVSHPRSMGPPSISTSASRASSPMRSSISTRRRATLDGPAPPFAELGEHADSTEAIAIPIVLAGEVVAVLYVDQPDAEPGILTLEPATLEVLARHAARALESLTAFKAVRSIVRADALSWRRRRRRRQRREAEDRPQTTRMRRRGDMPGSSSPRSSCITRTPSPRDGATAIWRRGSAGRSRGRGRSTNSACRRTCAARPSIFTPSSFGRWRAATRACLRRRACREGQAGRTRAVRGGPAERVPRPARRTAARRRRACRECRARAAGIPGFPGLESRPGPAADRPPARAARPVAALDGARKGPCPDRGPGQPRHGHQVRGRGQPRESVGAALAPCHGTERSAGARTSSTTKDWPNSASGNPPKRAPRFRRFRPSELAGFLVEASALREAESDEALGDYAAALLVYERLSVMKTSAPEEVLDPTGEDRKSRGRRREGAGGARARLLRVSLQRAVGSRRRGAGHRVDGAGEPARSTRAGARRTAVRGQAIHARASGVRAPSQRRAGRRSRSRSPASGRGRLFHQKRYRAARDGVRPYIDGGPRQSEALYFYAVSLRELDDRSQYLTLLRRDHQRVPGRPVGRGSPEQSRHLTTSARTRTIWPTGRSASCTRSFRPAGMPSGRPGRLAGGRIATRSIAKRRTSSRGPRPTFHGRTIARRGCTGQAARTKRSANSRRRRRATRSRSLDYLNSYHGRLAAARLDGRLPERRLVVVRPRAPRQRRSPADADAAPPRPCRPTPRSFASCSSRRSTIRRSTSCDTRRASGATRRRSARRSPGPTASRER